MIFDLFLSSSTQSSSVGREKESLSNATITTTTRTPPSIGFASSENLFSYVRLPVSKSVESIVWSVRCVERTREQKERRDQIQSISARAYYCDDRKKESVVPFAPFAMSG